MPVSACPKQMTYGPCGGVTLTGRCETGELSCPFVPEPLVEWPGTGAAGGAGGAGGGADPDLRVTGPNSRARALRERLAMGRAVVADFPARALDSVSLRACAAALGDVDAVLIGDAPRHRVQFPPAYRAALIQAAGATAWPGLNTRDRNRVALEGELAALADLGVAGVHCITGDHPVRGTRPDAAAVFDLDSTELTAMAAGRGVIVSVGESPAAPPVERRPARLLSKERAGAEVCFVNHCGGDGEVARFIRASRELGSTATMIACVPLVCDAGSAQTLATFAGTGTGAVDYTRILAAEDPRRAGIEAAIDAGRRMLETGVVAGVNLSGGPAEGEELAYAEALAEVAEVLAR